MELKYHLEQLFQTPSFLQEQLAFENVIVESQIKNCFKYTTDQEFQKCKKAYSRYRKSYKFFVQNLSDLLQKNVRVDMEQNCCQIQNDIDFVNCLTTQNQINVVKLDKYKQMIFQLRRKMIENLIDDQFRYQQ